MSRLNIIASAVGTERAVKENLALCFGYMSDCGVFNLHPFDTATVKKQTNICSLFVSYWLNYGNGLIIIFSTLVDGKWLIFSSPAS